MSKHGSNDFSPRVGPPTPPYDGMDKHEHRSRGTPRPYVRGVQYARPSRLVQMLIGLAVVAFCGFMVYALFRSGALRESASLNANGTPLQGQTPASTVPLVIVLASLVVAAVITGSIIVDSRRSNRAHTISHNTSPHAGQNRAAEIADNADRAIKRAEYDLTDMPLLLDDIGVVAYKDSINPKVVRVGGVSTDATHLRPFVVLTPRSKHDAGRVPITFNVLDEHGTVCYISRATYTLQHKQNFVAPSTWLELTNASSHSGKWLLHVSINDQPPMAIHKFGWYEPVDVQFNSEGEIDVHTLGLMKQHLAFSDDEPLSLDDLLAEQKSTST